MSGGGVGEGGDDVEAFIARWRASEGAERAAYAQFLTDFCRLIGVETPLPPTSDAEAVTYRFEYPVKFRDPAGTATTGRIDLYKKSCFVLEADFTGQGDNYVHFPDRHRFRVYLEDLRGPAIRAWIARIWNDLFSLGPSRQAALATRQIAQRSPPGRATRRAPSSSLVATSVPHRNKLPNSSG